MEKKREKIAWSRWDRNQGHWWQAFNSFVAPRPALHPRETKIETALWPSCWWQTENTHMVNGTYFSHQYYHSNRMFLTMMATTVRMPDLRPKFLAMAATVLCWQIFRKWRTTLVCFAIQPRALVITSLLILNWIVTGLPPALHSHTKSDSPPRWYRPSHHQRMKKF